SNLGPDRLYRNRGDFHFEDITERTGVADSVGWKTGVTMADVNGDGRLDIYVSAVSYLTMHGRNVLYINTGDRTFTDRTTEYGLEHVGFSTQAAFFDYDADGDLDMYLLNHSAHTERGVSARPQRAPRHPRAGDRLFRNDGNRFVDVSARAGIYGGVEGYGLGVIASDLNLDGCPDLFVANDFQENDFLYVNNCDGTFTESIGTALAHTSRSSMGVDAADFNNDGRPDLMVLDMLPEREDILKTSANAENFNLFNLKLETGYHAQYARNTLQLNRGRGRFSDIGYLAGVYATDWSWAPLFADLDNDGYKDLFITNGIYRRPNDLDFINYVSNHAIQISLAQGITADNLPLLQRMPTVPLANYAYRNNGDLTFTSMAGAWGLAQPGFSNGAAYVDLNNDGALDLVVSNVNAPAGIYRGRARENGHHYLQVMLRGAGANTAGIGAKVTIVHHGRRQMLEQMPTRGFQSSVDPRLHFGLGDSRQIDSLLVIWPDRRYQVLTNVPADRTVTLTQSDAAGTYAYPHGPAAPPLFADVTARLGIDVRHEENIFYDYNREPLMPHQLSTEGPALATGDVNGDGLDDIYVGGAKWQAGRLLVQRRDGRFRAGDEHVFAADRLSEDVDAAFFDADGDGDHDLYVVSGGNEFWEDHDALQDRLYVNDGKGNVHRAGDALPRFSESGSCVVPGDFDGDGDVDLFVGRRVVARNYGTTPRSLLLQNDGTGRFTDVTAEQAEGLAGAGMVSSAVWVDYDGDGQLDLIVVGEWMPVRVFRRENERFVDRTAEAGFSGTNGWWNSVTAVDLNGDGRRDLVLGNLGLNSYIRASPEEPARLYVHDFFQNGAVEQILTSYRHGVSYPLAGRDELVRQMPQLRHRYPSYAAFGASRIEDILPASQLRQATVLEARVFASAVALNNGNGTFDLRPLPVEAQFAPIYASLAEDLDRDGRTDLLLAGNFYGVTPVRGRYDASYGLLLRGDGMGRFEAVDLEASGLVIEGQVRAMKLLRSAGGDRLIVVARSGGTLQVLRTSLVGPGASRRRSRPARGPAPSAASHRSRRRSGPRRWSSPWAGGGGGGRSRG
ncbi:MAG: VCBS repeat-containing protein, partial [Gemmatimonadales bacterium]